MRCGEDWVRLIGKSLNEAVNVVYDCFEFYSRWGSAMEEAIDCKEPLQCLLDVCALALPHPIVVVRPDTKLLAASSKAEQIMLKQIENTAMETDLRYWVHPDLLHLSEMDKRYHTDNLYTLFIYLLCAGNLTDAAVILGLHRNSVK